ncbi:hypothetical protein DMN91_006492 [Ooceraea biroi]|uniref:Protein takeout n=2 Tax=Ooceraea biroi TaxID=2015173 RepID=A0A3L8DPE5_OOCBI|nr:hypothetical protein DMN91_006492 [Ooceraea biroi]
MKTIDTRELSSGVMTPVIYHAVTNVTPSQKYGIPKARCIITLSFIYNEWPCVMRNVARVRCMTLRRCATASFTPHVFARRRFTCRKNNSQRSSPIVEYGRRRRPTMSDLRVNVPQKNTPGAPRAFETFCARVSPADFTGRLISRRTRCVQQTRVSAVPGNDLPLDKRKAKKKWGEMENLIAARLPHTVVDAGRRTRDSREPGVDPGFVTDRGVFGRRVSGPSKFEIRNFKADVSNLVFTYNLHFNQLDFRGKYKIDASILLLRLIGDGNVTGSFFDYESDSYMKANKIVKNNNTYIEFEKMKFRIKIGGAKINLDNLFGGDPILGPASNEVLNANSDLFLDEIKPVLEDALSNIFTNVANKITGSFTYDELFPSK